MKVLTQYIVKMTDGSTQNGRKAWIGRNQNGELTFSTIYQTKENACNDITENELKYLKEHARNTKSFKIIEVIS